MVLAFFGLLFFSFFSTGLAAAAAAGAAPSSPSSFAAPPSSAAPSSPLLVSTSTGMKRSGSHSLCGSAISKLSCVSSCPGSGHISSPTQPSAKPSSSFSEDACHANERHCAWKLAKPSGSRSAPPLLSAFTVKKNAVWSSPMLTKYWAFGEKPIPHTFAPACGLIASRSTNAPWNSVKVRSTPSLYPTVRVRQLGSTERGGSTSAQMPVPG
mmetsp:Transcript_22443/g.56712  ORF Transcript_22443/g.56712 Transcript_22443/m.56712 type:complete len:211 (-) Transcript_22443:1796-2428(-)